MSTGGDALAQSIDAHVSRIARQRADALETVCEKAIQGGEFGVMVDYNVGAWVDPRVPYGNIWDVTACGSDGVQVS